MKIAIFTISLGKYDIFFEELYHSVMHKFLPNHEKTFFVFSDKIVSNEPNVRIFEQKKLGWPYDSMMRFHMLNNIKEELVSYDFIFFMNINMSVRKEITEIILPKKEHNYLVGAQHPGYIHNNIDLFTYDRNKNSTCYIPYGQGKIYYQGCFNGGRVKEFLEMSEILASNIDIDLKNGIIPLWHDESQLNWYFLKKEPMCLSHEYIYPDFFENISNAMMIQIEKSNYGGHDYLRS